MLFNSTTCICCLNTLYHNLFSLYILFSMISPYKYVLICQTITVTSIYITVVSDSPLLCKCLLLHITQVYICHNAVCKVKRFGSAHLFTLAGQFEAYTVYIHLDRSLYLLGSIFLCKTILLY